ncbi:MAG: TraC family protein [Patescibacteria group bacterium]
MPAKNKLAANKISAATQRYLDIAEIRDGALVMKDGTMRSILLVSSLNFALKSEDEQNAIVSAYVSFLNNLEHPLQIVIQSREFKIDPYLEMLDKKQREQTNELLRMQTAEYLSYIKELISLGKIMNKRFFITVTYDPLSNKQKGFFPRLIETFKPVTLIRLKEEKFQRRREVLAARVDEIAGGLASMGLQVAALDTQSIIELLYTTYNPDTAQNQTLVEVNKLMAH